MSEDTQPPENGEVALPQLPAIKPPRKKKLKPQRASDIASMLPVVAETGEKDMDGKPVRKTILIPHTREDNRNYAKLIVGNLMQTLDTVRDAWIAESLAASERSLEGKKEGKGVRMAEAKTLLESYKLLMEMSRYAYGDTKDTAPPQQLPSADNAMGSLLLGVAGQHGKIASIETKVDFQDLAKKAEVIEVKTVEAIKARVENDQPSDR